MIELDFLLLKLFIYDTEAKTRYRKIFKLILPNTKGLLLASGTDIKTYEGEHPKSNDKCD